MKVYLAGKIAQNDWRHSVVSRLGLDAYNQPLEWQPLTAAIRGRHDYVGPFFVGCDHGCFHGEASHGVGAGGVDRCAGMGLAAPDRGEVVRRCFAAIDLADVVFAWLEADGDAETTAYGTLVEIGYARARGKVIVTASRPADDRWLWFARASAGAHVVADDPVTALSIVLDKSDGADAEHRRFMSACESPIEEALGAALLRTDIAGHVAPQHVVEVGGSRYRLDFAIDAGSFKIAIECDGHDFHERTKEQAAHDRSRDRALTLEGWTVLRFTGSEIHRDADRCARQVEEAFVAGVRRSL